MEHQAPPPSSRPPHTSRGRDRLLATTPAVSDNNKQGKRPGSKPGPFQRGPRAGSCPVRLETDHPPSETAPVPARRLRAYVWAKTSPARSRLPNAALRWTLEALAVNHLPMNAITAALGVGVEHRERHAPGRRQTTAHRPTRPPRRRDSHRHGGARVASHRIAPGLVEDVGPRVEAWLRIGAPIADVRLRRLLCAGPHGRRRRVRPERVATRRGLRRVVRRSARSNRPQRGTGRLGRCRGLWRPRRRVSRWTAR